MTQSAQPPSPETLLEHREWLRAMARHLVADESAVDDVEQRTWLTVLRNRRPVTSARGWLRSVVRSAAADGRRSDSRREARERISARPEALPPTDHLVMQLEAQRAVTQAIAGLPEPYRTTVLLRYVDELPVKEVAERMSVPVATVKTRLHRALALLRDALDREFGDRRAWCLALVPLWKTRPPIRVGAAMTGVLLMTAKAKILAAAAAIALLVTAIVWTATPDSEETPSPNVAAAPQEVAAAPPQEKAAPRSHARSAQSPPAPEVPAPVPAGPSVAGRVIDGEGHPVAGARVISHPDDLSKPIDVSKAGEKDSRSYSTASGADGRFDVRIDAKSVQVILTVTSDAGFGQAAAGPKDRDVEIKLVPWTVLGGKVTNTAKEPVAGAKVTMHLLLDALVEDRNAVTDADGAYQFERVPPLRWSADMPFVGRGRFGWVVAEADGYAPLFVERDGMGAPPSGDSKKLDLVLVRGITLSGKVIDADTKSPLAGATVVCWSVEGEIWFGSLSGVSIANPWGPRPLGETKSADDGSYRFEHLPAQGPSGVASHNSGKRGTTLGHVAAWKDGYVFGGDEIPVSKDGASLETTIELWPSATVTGRVVDEGGKPIAGATVYVSVEERHPALNGFPSFYEQSKKEWATTGADGSYSLPSFRATRTGPTTGKLGAYLRSGRSATSKPVDVTANVGETITAPDLVIDFGLFPRATILVSDAGGAPVAGATAELQSQWLRSRLDGRIDWTLGYAPPKPDAPIAARSVVIRARGFVPQQVDFTPTLGTPVELSVVLKPGVRISGRVQMSDGRPAAKASVVVADGTKSAGEVFGDGSRSPGREVFDRLGNARLVVYANVTAAADGTFEAPDLPDGPYLVAAQMGSRAPAGFNHPQKMLRDVRSGVAAGASDLVFTIPPDDAPPTQALELVVTDAAGAPVEKCYAQATFGAARLYAQPTEGSKLRFEALPAGKGVVEVFAQGWATTTLRDVVIGTDAPQPIAVRMDRGITLRGTVRPDSGTLPAEASIVVVPVEQTAMGGAAVGEMKKDGTFEMTGFRSGRFRMTVSGGDVRNGAAFVPSGDGIVTVPEGGRDVVVDLMVVRAGTLSMLVRDARLPSAQFSGGSGDPAKDKFGAEARIEVLDATGAIVSVQSPVYTDFSPSVTVAPGDYVVRVRLPGEAPQDQRVSVKAGESVVARFPAR